MFQEHASRAEEEGAAAEEEEEEEAPPCGEALPANAGTPRLLRARARFSEPLAIDLQASHAHPLTPES